MRFWFGTGGTADAWRVINKPTTLSWFGRESVGLADEVAVSRF